MREGVNRQCATSYCEEPGEGIGLDSDRAGASPRVGRRRVRGGWVPMVLVLALQLVAAADVVPPQEVTQLTVKDVGANVMLSWHEVDHDVTGLTEFIQVYRAYSGLNNPNFTPVTPLGIPTGATSFTHVGSPVGTFDDPNDYFYLVSAVDDGNIESNTRPSKASTPSIKSLAYSNGSAILEWFAATNANGYRVFWGTSSLAYTSSADVGTLQKTVPSLAAGATYYFTVLAKDTNGNLSNFVSEVSLSTTGSSPPGITATSSPQPNVHGWNNTNVTVNFACSQTGGTLSPSQEVAAPGTSSNFGSPGNAWDGNTSANNFASCNYGNFPGVCGGEFFGFPAGTQSGHLELFMSHVFGSGCQSPHTDAYYLDSNSVWQHIINANGSYTETTYVSPSLNSGAAFNVGTLRVRVLGGLNCTQPPGTGTARLHELRFIADSVGCPAPITVTTEGANQIATGTASGPGGTTTVRLAVSIDKTAPTVNATSTPPPNAAGWNKTNVAVHFTCQDPLSGVDSCEGPVTVASEGAGQVVTGHATDRAGNTGTGNVTLNIDKTLPVVIITSPPPNATTSSSTLAVSGSASDANPITSVTCNGVAATVSGGSFSCLLPVSGPSPFLITIVATDIAGNAKTATRSIAVALPPQVTITAPSALTVFNTSPILVQGTVSESTAAVQVNGVTAVLTPNGSGAAFEAENVPLEEGNNLITATATNSTGGVGTATIQVTLDTQPPTVTIDSPADGLVTSSSVITVAGMINDIVVGTVNAGQATVTVRNVTVGPGQGDQCPGGTP